MSQNNSNVELQWSLTPQNYMNAKVRGNLINLVYYMYNNVYNLFTYVQQCLCTGIRVYNNTHVQYKL